MTLSNLLESKDISPKEIEVSKLVCKGYSNLEIANLLVVKEVTIKFHLKNIYKKLTLKNRSQLIIFCLPYINFNMENSL